MTTPAQRSPDVAAAPASHRTEGYLNHVAWGLLGLAGTASLWWAGTVVGALSLFVVIGLAFVFWNRLGSRGAWMAVLLLGASMCGLTAWQAVTAARCPGAGDELVMSVTKPGVNCEELRASATTMSVLFGFFAIMGAIAPFYGRKIRNATPDDVEVDDAGNVPA